jgi:tripartite-type tricarboxylate transporter receptor subunit TctC
MKLLPRRKFLRLAAGIATFSAMSGIASAQSYPSRPIRVIVGAPPGSSPDVSARLMGQWLSKRLGQPFVIEDRSGATGSLAAEAVVRAPPDGYTLLLASTPDAINPALYSNLNFDFTRDIVPVASIRGARNRLSTARSEVVPPRPRAS